MDPDTEVQDDFPPFIRVYKSGRVQRLVGTDTVPASTDHSTGVISKDVLIDPTTGASARLYLPKKTEKKLLVLVYYHGGAFCVGSAFSSAYHHWVTSLVAESNIIAVSVEYRLAPEHPLPAAYDDAWCALSWLAKQHAGGESSENWLMDHADFGRVFIGGDSAGANIVHRMAMLAGGERGTELGLSIRGAVLIHPYFPGRRAAGEEREGEERFCKFVYPSAMDGVNDVRINPLVEGPHGLARLGCERVMVIVAEQDTLRERGRAYYEALKESGWNGEVEFVEHQGKGHVFHLFDHRCDEAVDLMKRLVAFMIQ